MNSTAIINIIRFLGLAALQVLVLRQLNIGPIAGMVAIVFVYPLFIFLFPIRIPREFLLLFGFFLGLCIDLFYDSPGLHAGASVLTAFVRPFVLRRFEPRGGYNLNQGLTINRYGMPWFLRYTSLMLFLHIFWYYLLDAFTPGLIGQVFVKTAISLFASSLFILILMLIFNPKD